MTSFPLVAAVLVALLIGLALSAHSFGRPRFALAFYWVVMCAVPYWIELGIAHLEFPPQTIAAIIILPSALRETRSVRLMLGDVLVGVFFLFILIGWTLNLSGSGGAQLLLQGGTGYLVARTFIPRVDREWLFSLVRISAVVVSVWAVIEYFADVQLFAHLDYGPEWPLWTTELLRGGHVRSDTAFGQPIILGAFLAFALPFVVVWGRGVWLRFAAISLIGLAIYTTASRGPVLAAVLGVALTLVFTRTLPLNTRVSIGVLCLGIAVPLGLALNTTLTQAGASASQTVQYRGSLYGYVLQDIHPLGVANNVVQSLYGQYKWRDFGSVDSAFISTALTFGWIPALLGMVGILIGVIRTIVGRATVPQVAFAAQIPVLATVALVTQYRTLVFFMAAMAVTVSARPVVTEFVAEDRSRLGRATHGRVGANVVVT